jgi:hypothetical protein
MGPRPDIAQNATVRFEVTTVANGNGVATTIANGNVVVFKDGSNSNFVDGVTLNVDWGITGRQLISVNTAANNTLYSNGSTFFAAFMNGNCNGSSLAGYGVGSFTVGVGVTQVNGNVTGSILGSMNGNVGGNVNGSVLGNMNGNIAGTVANVTGTPNINLITWLGAAPEALVSARVVALLGAANTGSIAAGTIASGELTNIELGVWDKANGLETGATMRQGLRYTAASGAGNLTGGNTTEVQITGLGVATLRITAAVEANGNTRTVVLS